MRLRIITPDGNVEEHDVADRVIRLGRDSVCEIRFDARRFPKISGVHAQIEQTPTGPILSHKSQSNQTLVNAHPIEGTVPLRPGDRIQLGYTGPIVQVLISQTLEPPKSSSQTVKADVAHLSLIRGTAEAERFEIRSGGVIGRDSSHSFVLDHPHVSRSHARLTVAGNHVVLKDLKSANGTYVNGTRIRGQVTLQPGDQIDIGPFRLTFDGMALISRSRSNNIELVARKVSRVVKDRSTGKPLTLLDGISLVIRPREFVCLLGPSGSGKSTLLNILSGRKAPDKGAILINGESLYENFDALKQDMAVVPQKDVLHDSLAIGTALRYTANLRLPPDTGREEVTQSVADMLDVVGLTKRRGTLIRDLSGGQVKRASLANELIARPSLLFLDEVTSGLDEQTDREMMELFRQVADSGKTVVCITHSLSNVEETCHMVVILTEGGRLAFIGTPKEARDYFGIERLGHVYKKLSERSVEEWQADFKASQFYARYVRERMSVLKEEEDDASETLAANEHTQINPLRQARILTQRYLSVCWGDRTALATLLGQALLVGLLLSIVFGQLGKIEIPIDHARRAANLLFLLNVACFWFGCNTAAKELVKERVIYTRERGYNLRIDSYFVSKFVVLVLIVVVQVTLLFAIVRYWSDPPGSILGQWASLVSLAIAGTAVGLLISALAKTEDVAIALVPITIIPQIILGGVIAPLSGVGKLLAELAISVYWSEQTLESFLPASDRELIGSKADGFIVPLGIVLSHSCVFGLMTMLVLVWRDRTSNR
jgi:ABC-type multidrug transport system ATPase subunit